MVYFYMLKMFQVYGIYAQQFSIEVALDFIAVYKGMPEPNILVQYIVKICLFLVYLITLYY